MKKEQYPDSYQGRHGASICKTTIYVFILVIISLSIKLLKLLTNKELRPFCYILSTLFISNVNGSTEPNMYKKELSVYTNLILQSTIDDYIFFVYLCQSGCNKLDK